MSTYKIFDLLLLFTDFKDKFEDENCVFIQKFAIGVQQIRVYRLN